MYPRTSAFRKTLLTDDPQTRNWLADQIALSSPNPAKATGGWKPAPKKKGRKP